MIYLSGIMCADLQHRLLGFMATPRGRNVLPGMIWAADNDRFNAPETYSDEGYLAWLGRQPAATCLFATAPDVLGDHEATVKLSRPMFPRLRAIGYRTAFVAQDGWRDDTTPWGEFDVLFVGGSDDFKLGRGAEAVAAAVDRGMSVHYGRANSFKRYRLAALLGCASADGTFLKFAPDINKPRMLRWFDKIERSALLPFQRQPLKAPE